MAETVPQKDLHRIVTTCIIYDSERRYLLRKRDVKGPFPNRWEVPGGGVELEDYTTLPRTRIDGWENVLDVVLRREVMEETGLEVGEVRYMGNSFFIRLMDDIPVCVLRFAAPHVFGEVVISEDATEYAWVTAEDIDSYNPIGSIATDIKKLDALLAQE